MKDPLGTSALVLIFLLFTASFLTRTPTSDRPDDSYGNCTGVYEC